MAWTAGLLVYCPVLNFVQNSIEKGFSPDIMKKHMSEFFTLAQVSEARRQIFQFCHPGEIQPKRVGTNAFINSVSDIIDTIAKYDADDVGLPVFVIRHPSEVPLIPADAFCALSCRVNSCLSELRSLSECVRTLLPGTIGCPPSLMQECTVSSKPSYAVILKNPPTDLKDPIERKETLDTLDGHDGIVSVRSDPVKKRWVVHTRDKASAVSLAAAATSQLNVSTHVLNQKVLGIVSNIPVVVQKSELISMIPGLVDATKIGSSGSFRLEFLDDAALNKAINEGLCLGYELFKIRRFQKLPPRCYRCQSPNHIVGNCPLPSTNQKCSRCAAGHCNTRDNPCTESLNCANCGGNHVSYSLRCPVLKKALNKDKK